MASSRKRPSRLGRGLSSLMAQSVPTAPPDETAPPAESRADTEQEQQPSSSPAHAAPAPEDSAEARTTTATTTTAAALDAVVAEPAQDSDNSAEPRLRYIPIDCLRPNPHQPRQQFDEAALHRLADSIRSDGLMQPIVVRPRPTQADASTHPAAHTPDSFDIVAGERRWCAAQLAALEHVPAIVRDLDDRALAEWALIENLQREDLNPIERAQAFQHLAERFELGHDEIARRVGLERLQYL